MHFWKSQKKISFHLIMSFKNNDEILKYFEKRITICEL